MDRPHIDSHIDSPCAAARPSRLRAAACLTILALALAGCRGGDPADEPGATRTDAEFEQLRDRARSQRDR